ncbi:MAG TPA: hypothetical protein VNA65_07740 [Candidatus Dormibacteraeota bacterium]|nr:hypothetical protein [Candidatus Dormibacteraeota bacterium]
MSARADLGNLEASGLIQIATIEPELEYLFRHALIQEAAYATLLKQDRRTLHQAAAETILALHPDREAELASVLAMHFELAGDSGRAVHYLLLAGDHALERFASKEAARFFKRASELSDPSQVEIRLSAAIGAAKAGWGYPDRDADIARLEAAIVGAEKVDQRLLSEAWFWIAFLRGQRGERPESSPALKNALDRGEEIAESLNDPRASALPKALLGAYSAFTGQLWQGARAMQDALDVVETHGDPVSTAMISNFLTITYARLGEFEKADEILERGRRVAGSSDAISRLDVEITTAAVQLERGELDNAVKSSLACLGRAEDLGAYACVVAATTMFGAASVRKDDPVAAKAPLERGRDLSLVTNMAPMRTLIHGFLGNVKAQLGDLPGGIADWDTALASAGETGDRFGEAHTFWARARAYARGTEPEWEAALQDFDRAIALFEAIGAKPSLARALHDRATALNALGRLDAAAESDQRATELGTQLGLRDMPFA